MGHLGNLKKEYRDLVRRLDANPVGMPEPATERARTGWRDILEILYTPEEAALAARLPVLPSSLKAISNRVGISQDDLQPRLEAMANKGLVLDLVSPRTGKVKYLLSPPVVGFFEFSMMRAHDSMPKKQLAEALEAYAHGDDTFAREVFSGDTVIGRAMVHETALPEALFDDPRPDVLDWESSTAVIAEASTLAVSMCYCRHKAEHLGKRCSAPMDNCLSMNSGADFVIRRGFGRRIEQCEALDILHASRESGLVQIADNVQHRPAYLCNCCGCCCGQLQAINDFDLPAVNPSGFVANSDRATCTGCSRCARTCPVKAITMKPQRGFTTRKSDLGAQIDGERCIGCGVCVATCRKSAMTMRRRAVRPHVPVNAIERTVRMALERGRLPHLLFDEGANRGSRFLNHVVQTLCRLPPAERLLANHQLHSRFVSFTLGLVHDPTDPGTSGPSRSDVPVVATASTPSECQS